MKFFILLSLVTIATAFTSLAQESAIRGRIGFCMDGVVLISDYDKIAASNLYKYGIGGSLKIDFPILTPGLFLSTSGGYTSFKLSDTLGSFARRRYPPAGLGSENFILLKFGVKYYFNKVFFAEVLGGAAFHTGRDLLETQTNGAHILYSPGIGYSFGNGIEIGARFESWKLGSEIGNMNQLDIRLAYMFKLP